MRVLLISDIHGNPWALNAVEAAAGPVDRIFFIGDAVNYGPGPAQVIDWLNSHSVVGVRGNHDHAVAYASDPKASLAKAPLARAMRDWTRDQLDPAHTAFLLELPRRVEREIGGAKIIMVHATPADPLYDYRLRPDASDELLDDIVSGLGADVLMVGHTHLPMQRSHGSLRIVNPGSVGQPLDGDPRAAYAVWEDGAVELRRVEYDRTPVLRALSALPMPRSIIDDLCRTLSTGSIA